MLFATVTYFICFYIPHMTIWLQVVIITIVYGVFFFAFRMIPVVYGASSPALDVVVSMVYVIFLGVVFFGGIGSGISAYVFSMVSLVLKFELSLTLSNVLSAVFALLVTGFCGFLTYREPRKLLMAVYDSLCTMAIASGASFLRALPTLSSAIFGSFATAFSVGWYTSFGLALANKSHMQIAWQAIVAFIVLFLVVGLVGYVVQFFNKVIVLEDKCVLPTDGTPGFPFPPTFFPLPHLFPFLPAEAQPLVNPINDGAV